MASDDNGSANLEKLQLQKIRLEVKGLRASIELSKKKLELEINNLRHGFRRTLATALITALVSIGIAGGGWLLQRRSERAADARSERNHREEVFAKVLENFGSSNPSARMSAAVALSSFARNSDDTAAQTLAALTNRLAVEDDLAVQEQIINTLTRLGKPGLEESAKANRRAAMQFARDCGQYVGLLMARDSVKTPNSDKTNKELESKIMGNLSRRLNAVGFPLQQDYSLIFGVSFKDLLEGILLYRYRWSKNASREAFEGMDSEKLDRLTDDTWESLRRTTRFLAATSIAIERELQNLNGQLRGENLDSVVILFGHLEKLDLRGVSFRKSFLAANAQDADLSFCDFTGANLEHLNLVKAKLRAATLTRTTVEGDTFGEDKDNFADLTGANWWDAKERNDKGELMTPDWMEAELPRATQESERQKLLKEWEVTSNR